MRKSACFQKRNKKQIFFVSSSETYFNSGKTFLKKSFSIFLFSQIAIRTFTQTIVKLAVHYFAISFFVKMPHFFRKLKLKKLKCYCQIRVKFVVAKEQ